MADVCYFPLLKRNFQRLGDTAAMQAEIDALQSALDTLQSSLKTLQTNLNALKNSKITKVTAAAQLTELTDGEIFEWQSASTHQFTQGYFYKKNNNSYTRVDLQPNYTLPTAAADVLGGVKVGQGLSIDNNGVLSAAAGDNLKIPRCFSQAQIDALSDGDIFQWQAATSEHYINGYFYKKTGGTTVEVVAGSKYLFVSPAVDFGQYSIKAGYYTFVENTNITTVTGDFTVEGTGHFSSFLYLTYQPVAVGNKACKYVESTNEFVDFVEITAVNSKNIPSEMSDGATTINRSHSTTPYSSVIAKYQNINTLDVVYCVCIPFGSSGVNGVMLVDVINNVIYPIKRVNYLERTASEDITVSTVVISRVDTQPNSAYSLPIAAANVLGGVKVGSGLSIDANGVLSVSGEGPFYNVNVVSLSEDVNIVDDTVAYFVNGLLFYFVNITTYNSISSDTSIFKFVLNQFYVLSAVTIPIQYVNGYNDASNNILLVTQGSNTVTTRFTFPEDDYWISGVIPCTLTAI